MELFSGSGSHEPLAARMRPRKLDEYIGQDHIVGPGRLLRRAIQADQLTSVLFYGPPGTGKTTLARVIANHTKSNFVTLNAVLAGVQQIRTSIAAAEEQKKLYSRRTILFVDEVHRWNRAQQDALLPWVENGTLILIGATTENPFFEVNKALVSRSRVFQLKPLSEQDLKKAALACLADKERGYGRWKVDFTPGALEHLIKTASGDARSLLNALELAVETCVDLWPPKDGTVITIDQHIAEESIQQKVVLYDKDGDYHYDVISAFIKSLRGRDPDAAMYWLARMVAAGEDPGFIFRRMLISACEDTGLADPMAISVVESCAAAFDRVGLPEGRYHLAHAALYLSTAPKSNSSMAFFDALSSVEKEDSEVPNHLKDGNRDAEGFGHGKGYLYPHAFKEHWTAQQYLPDSLVGRVFYTPTGQGYEGAIRSEVLTNRELQIAALLEKKDQKAEPGEILTFSHITSQSEEWTERTESGKSKSLLTIRNELMETAGILRHHRVLIDGADDGLLIWESSRQAPEGCTCGICRTSEAQERLTRYAETLEELDRPVLAVASTNKGNPFDFTFDRILSRDPASTVPEIIKWVQNKQDWAHEGSIITCAIRIPSSGMRLSRLLNTENPLRLVAETVENEFYTNADNPLFAWSARTLQKELTNSGFSARVSTLHIVENRYIREQDLELWLSPEKSSYGTYLNSKMGTLQFSAYAQSLMQKTKNTTQEWHYEIALCRISLTP